MTEAEEIEIEREAREKKGRCEQHNSKGELELLPCPLAHDGDRTAYIRTPKQWNLKGFCVECRGCGLSSTYFYTTPESAAAHWNRRADVAIWDSAFEAAAKVVQALKYYERGEGLEDDDPHSDNHPDYERYMIDERLQDAADAIRALKKGE